MKLLHACSSFKTFCYTATTYIQHFSNAQFCYILIIVVLQHALIMCVTHIHTMYTLGHLYHNFMP